VWLITIRPTPRTTAQIFQWLIKYLNEPGCPPPLDTTNVISILISSQFLKMSSLVDMCLAYVCGNLNEILKMPIDLNCLNQGAPVCERPDRL
jgi:hypothetical protein